MIENIEIYFAEVALDEAVELEAQAGTCYHLAVANAPGSDRAWQAEKEMLKTTATATALRKHVADLKSAV